MRSKIIILFILISTALLGLDILGIVVNEKGKPIDNVIVSTDSKAVITGKNGRFILKDISTDNKVTFHKIGYADIILSADKIPSKLILQIAPIQIPGVQVTKARSNEVLLKTPDKIVIQVDLINNFKNAADILRNRADLLISGTKLHGEQQNVSIPGYKARHTLVMLDGIPLNRSGTAFDISTIPAEIIESIEIIKGSASSQGGAGSMGGIININTKQSEGKLSASVNHGFGSFGLDKTSLTLSGTNSQFQGYAFLSISFSRNDFEYEPYDYWPNPDSLRTREYNDKKSYDANLNIGYSNSFCGINYKLLYQDFFKKLPGSINNLDWFKNSRLTGKTQRHFLNFTKGIQDYILKTDLFYSNEKTTYDNTRLDYPFNTQLYEVLGNNFQLSRGAKCKLEYQNDIFYFDWGGDYRYENYKYEEITNEVNSIPQVFRENFAAFGNTKLEQSLFPYRIGLIASARWDHTTDFKDFTSWRISPEFTYENILTITLGGNISNGFTLPSFYSIYWKGDTQVAGNPDLKPEESLNWQLFSHFNFYDNFLKITYRHDDIDDMIYWDRDHNGKWKPHNLLGAEVNNYELELMLRPFKFIELNGIYNRTKAINRTYNDDGSQTAFFGKKIMYIPDYTFNLNMQINYKQLSGKVSYMHTGEQWTTRDQLMEEMQLPAYELVDSGVQYICYWNKFEILLGIAINNLFNELYEIYKYIPQPGFNWEINLGVKYEI
jgi:outer membrane receptor for ferrienterochelin and colicin